MYEISITTDGSTQLLHDTDPDSYRKIMAGSFTDVAASICRPTAQFSVPPQNPAYDDIHEMTTIVKITNTITHEVEFEGRVIRKLRESLSSDGKIIREYVAEGLISWLLDSRQMARKLPQTPTQALTYLLGQHNARHPGKAIYLGVCDVETGIIMETNYRSTLEEINVNLLQKLGGEIRVRRESNGLYLDYLQDGIGEDSTVVVQLGRNLRSLSQSTDPTKIVNRLIPLGAKQEDGSRLTLRGYYQAAPDKYWIDDSESVTSYTAIEGTETFDDAVTQQTLERLGTAALARLKTPKISYSAEVLDLSTIGEEEYSLRAGNTYNFVCDVLSLDENLRLTKRTVSILKPYSPTVEIGSKPERLSYTAAKTSAKAEDTAEIVDENLKDVEYVLLEDFEDYQDFLQEYIDALEVWREQDTSDPPEDIPLPDTMETLKQWQADTATYLTGIATWRTNVDTAISNLTTRIAALEANAVTSAAIRTIDVVQDMPVSPSATVLYVVDGGTS